MNDLRKIIAENICTLRTESGMTQASFAELLNYSDKAVSKWERGEAIPDITVLKQIADHFCVTVDYLLRSQHTEDEKHARLASRARARNRLLITLISASSVWVLAAFAFVILFASGASILPPWLLFIYAIPTSSVVVLVFNSIWGRRRLNFIIVSVLVWSLLLSVYLSLLMTAGLNIWILFIIGVPAQVVLLFIPGITVIKSGKESSI